MKTKLASLLILILACVPIATQTGAGLSQVTLYYYSPQDAQADRSRSAINFETGKRGLLPVERLADFDLMYGGLTIGRDGKTFSDWLRVTDARSMIVELGAKKWQDFKETPPFPQPKKPRPPQPLSNRFMVVDASAGSTDVSPYRQMVEVKPGYMYFVRILRGQKVSYTMFRVESLASKDNCVLTWKNVTPPNVDNEK